MSLININWLKVRQNLFSYYPQLVELLDEIIKSDKENDYSVSSIKYNYGEFIVKEGRLNLPETLSLEKYAFALVVGGHGLEMFIHEHDKIIPIAMLEPGQHFNLMPELCSSAFPLSAQNIIAGARSAFLVQKISNSNRFWHFARRHHLDFDIPQTLFDQWHVFSNLARNNKYDWKAEVLLFPYAWLENDKSLAVAELKKYLWEHQKPALGFLNSEFNFSRLLGKVMMDIDYKDAYFASTLKQIFAIASGFLPGFIIANSDLYLPCSQICKAFYQDYGGMQALPNIIVPGYPTPGTKCFYSFELETLIEQHCQRRKSHSHLDILKSLQMLYNQLQTHFRDTEIHDPIVLDFLKAQIAFIHNHGNSITAVNNTRKKESLAFLNHSTFARKGCAAIEPIIMSAA